jgi:hypothetical protein
MAGMRSTCVLSACFLDFAFAGTVTVIGSVVVTACPTSFTSVACNTCAAALVVVSNKALAAVEGLPT